MLLWSELLSRDLDLDRLLLCLRECLWRLGDLLLLLDRPILYLKTVNNYSLAFKEAKDSVVRQHDQDG